jgi:hypothetical protein
MRALRRLASSSTLVVVLSVATVAPFEAATEEPLAPTSFAGRIALGDQIRPETTRTIDGRTEYRGGAWTPSIIEMSDPRLDGELTISHDRDEYSTADGVVYAGSATWRITNADGAWQGSYQGLNDGEASSPATVVLDGEGGYEGLYAVWEQTPDDSGWDVHGIIFPAAPPAPPTAP